MNNKYIRVSLVVTAVQYEPNKGMEDGFELYTTIITKGELNPDNLVKITQPNGHIVCPYIQNRRGTIFIREGDYIIIEGDNERHVCGADKFAQRYQPIN